MPRHLAPPLLTALAILLFGVALGVYLQHRWPLGRWREHIAPAPARAEPTLADLARLPRDRVLVIAVAGQSNAANYGESRASAGEGVYVYHQGRLFLARDPLPGGDQKLGSIWTRLGARLRLTGGHDVVLFSINAVGSTRVADWAPGGALHPRLATSIQELTAAGLAPDLFLWQQGESEAWDPAASGVDYLRSLRELLGFVRSAVPGCRSVVALATHGRTEAVNAQIRAAQAAAAAESGALPGPDLDQLGNRYRPDGVHFNQRGLERAAALWHEAIAPALDRDPP